MKDNKEKEHFIPAIVTVYFLSQLSLAMAHKCNSGNFDSHDTIIINTTLDSREMHNLWKPRCHLRLRHAETGGD